MEARFVRLLFLFPYNLELLFLVEFDVSGGHLIAEGCGSYFGILFLSFLPCVVWVMNHSLLSVFLKHRADGFEGFSSTRRAIRFVGGVCHPQNTRQKGGVSCYQSLEAGHHAFVGGS